MNFYTYVIYKKVVHVNLFCDAIKYQIWTSFVFMLCNKICLAACIINIFRGHHVNCQTISKARELEKCPTEWSSINGGNASQRWGYKKE
jgi:hypothetical protein